MSVLSPTAPTPAVQVSFAVGVDMIKNGDLLSFFDTHEDSWLHRCTTVPILYGCGSKIFHSAIALWMTSGTGEKYLLLRGNRYRPSTHEDGTLQGPQVRGDATS